MSAAFDNFADVARRYCDWCEGAPLAEREEARTAYELLIALLHAQVSLPDAQPIGGDYDDDGHEDYKRMHKRFASLPFQYYRNQHDPLVIEAENGVGDLADDLADLWLDLRRGLLMLDGGHRDSAAWHWQLLFRAHWGRHATSAAYALHCWLVDTKDAS